MTSRVLKNHHKPSLVCLPQPRIDDVAQIPISTLRRIAAIGGAIVLCSVVVWRFWPDANKTLTAMYALEPDQSLKCILPPYPSCRNTVFWRKHPQASASPKNLFFRWNGTVLKIRGSHQGANAATIRDILPLLVDAKRQEIGGEELLLGMEIQADFVVRVGASTDSVLREFREFIKKEHGTDLTFADRDYDESVIVVAGTFEPNGGSTEWIDLTGGGEEAERGMGGIDHFLDAIAGYLGKRVVYEGPRGSPVSIKWRLSGTSSARASDLQAALTDLSRQTGLSFATGFRRVRGLVVERPDTVDKSPRPN